MRPLIATGDPKKSVDISRKAELYETSSGMLTITGGKLTTWRRMAKQTVDRLVEREGREAPCHTAEIPLGMEARPDDLEAPDGVGEEALEQLAFRYGHAARKVLALAREDAKLAAPIVPGRPDLLAEAVIAARHEQARTRRRRAAAPYPPRPARRAAVARSPPRPAPWLRRWVASSAGRAARSSGRPRPGRLRPRRPASTPPARPSSRCNNLPP